MQTIFNEQVSITIGNKTLISDSKIIIDKNTKYCILGANGVGKTTLMNHIYDTIKNNANVLYITQTLSTNEDECDMYTFMLKANNSMYTKYTRLVELEKKINE
jgi:ATPase subunit of ABC transporter with duplicated ATPase domains